MGVSGLRTLAYGVYVGALELSVHIAETVEIYEFGVSDCSNETQGRATFLESPKSL